MTKKKAPDDVMDLDQDVGSSEEVENSSNYADGAETGQETQDSGESAQGPGDISKEEEELNTKYLRLAADFQNYRKRTEKEKSDIYAYANEKIVVELLNVIDNFERALDHKDSNDSFAEGMDMIFKQLKGVLEKSGVEEMAAAGESFDPNFHHAVLTGASEEHESGKVIQVLQKGYLLNNKVIRPAMVKVAE